MTVRFQFSLVLYILFIGSSTAQNTFRCSSCESAVVAKEIVDLHSTQPALLFQCPMSIGALPFVYKWGIAKTDGNILVPPQWDSIGTFQNNLAEVFQYLPQRKKAPLKAGLINTHNQIILPLVYRTIQPLEKNYFKVNNGKGWMVWKNTTGFLSSLPYDSIVQNTQHTLLYTEGFCHRLDTASSKIIQGPYREWQVTDNGRVYPTFYDTLYLYRNGMHALISLPADSVKAVDLDQIIVYRNRLRLPFHFEPLPPSSQKVLSPKVSVPLSTLLDSTLIKIKDRSQADSIILVDDWYLYRRKNMWGYGDTLGNIGVGAQYEALRFQYNRRLAMKYRGKWGFLDDREKFIVQPYYDEVGDFIYKGAWVRQGNHYNFVDLQGKLLSTHGYDSLSITPGGNYLVRYKNKYGLVNTNGREIIGTRYQQLLDFGGGACLTQNEEGQWYLMNYSENRISQQPYREVQYLHKSRVYVLKK